MSRVRGLDAARGVAVLAMGLVHVLWFAHPTELVAGLDAFGRWTVALARVVIHGKFTVLFALVFGYAMALQYAALLRRGLDPFPFMRSRLWLIAGLGLVHGLALFWGDILFIYGAGTLVVFSLLDASTKRLYVFAGLFTAAAIGLGTYAAWFTSWRRVDASLFASADVQLLALGNVATWIGTIGSPAVLFIVGAILLGYALGRSRLDLDRERLDEWVQLAAAGWAFFTVLGVAAHLVGFAFAGTVLYYVSSPIGGVFYLTLALRYARPSPLLEAYGRHALSAYIAQSIMLVGVFYGLGLYGSVAIPFALILAVLMLTAQLAVVAYLDARGLPGPLEYVLRSALFRLHPEVRRVPRPFPGVAASPVRPV